MSRDDPTPAPADEERGPTLDEAARAFLAAGLDLDETQARFQARCDELRRELELDRKVAARNAAMEQLGALMPQDAVIHIGEWCLNRSEFEIRVDRIITTEAQR